MTQPIGVVDVVELLGLHSDPADVVLVTAKIFVLGCSSRCHRACLRGRDNSIESNHMNSEGLIVCVESPSAAVFDIVCIEYCCPRREQYRSNGGLSRRNCHALGEVRGWICGTEFSSLKRLRLGDRKNRTAVVGQTKLYRLGSEASRRGEVDLRSASSNEIRTMRNCVPSSFGSIVLKQCYGVRSCGASEQCVRIITVRKEFNDRRIRASDLQLG